jgi:2-succinyl-6-hydroxy-2,4-cyclohexadiene-1-carboxylate synthase
MPADLLLLHGFTQTGASWDGVRRALGARYRALAPDLGAGPWEAELDRLEALAPAAHVLIGYSMGGRIALAAALAMPARVERLVLVGASPGLADPEERARRRAADEALAERIEAIGVEAFAGEWGAQPLFAGQPERVAAAAHADRLRNTPEGLAAALRGLGTGAMEPLWDRLGELTMPVALVVGERDEKFRGVAERMRAALPDARVIVVPGAGHAAHLERPEAVAAVLAEPPAPLRGP